MSRVISHARRSVPALTASAVIASAALYASGPAQGSIDQPGVVGSVPAKNTPAILDGKVLAMAKVGDRIVVGGTFTQASSPGSTDVLTRRGILAFDAATGAVDPGFAPQLNGSVESLAASPDGSVFAAGTFSTVNGVRSRVAKLDVTTGAAPAGWRTPGFDGRSTAVAVSGSTVYVGGQFSKAGGQVHNKIAALDVSSGAVQPWFTMGLAGRHGTGYAQGTLGPKDIDVAPNGRDMVVIGNFTSASDSSGTVDRDQVLRATLTPGSGVTVRRDWRTLGFTGQCYNSAFDSWVRDVDWAPDGGYFVIASTGGDGTNVDGTRALCDTVTRFEASSTGSSVQPRWANFTGVDTVLSVAATGDAVYAGGHMRWMNNPNANNRAGEGAVPRPGLASLDPLNGIPNSWNPGRNPRGYGAAALLATSDGLYVGSDTSWIGNRQYRRDRVAFFPLSTGQALASNQVDALPGTVFSVQNGRLLAQSGSSAGFGAKQVVDTSTVPWYYVRSIFYVGGQVFYLTSDGTLSRRSFNGSTFGPATVVDPYNDPVWSNVYTGSGQTYRGLRPGIINGNVQMTSAFYTQGRLYYTVSGNSQMFWRGFNPDSGVLGGDVNVVQDGRDWQYAAGAFLSGNTLYVASSYDGALRAYTWDGSRVTGGGGYASYATDWRSQGMFVVGG